MLHDRSRPKRFIELSSWSKVFRNFLAGLDATRVLRPRSSTEGTRRRSRSPHRLPVPGGPRRPALGFHLQDASRIRRGTRIREGLAIEYPYFDLLGHQVWGATAMVLGEFVCLFGDR